MPVTVFSEQSNKLKMDRKILNISSICGLILSAVFLLFDWRMTTGTLLGLLFFRVYYYLLSRSIIDLIEAEISGNAFDKMVRLVILILPMLVGFLFPDYVSFWGAFAGLMAFKVTAVIYSIFSRE